jgi:Mce-associated membrane protein
VTDADKKIEDETTVTDVPEIIDEPAETEAAETEAAETEAAETTAAESTAAEAGKPGRRIDWARVVAFGVLPALALVLALAAGGLKYLDYSVADTSRAATESLRAAEDGTVAILSYTPDKVERQLNDARDLLSGGFRDSYTSLINDVVIPGAKQKQISAVAAVPAASVVSAEAKHAVILVFVNQTVVVGGNAPTATASSVNVTLDEVDGKWLISAFEPV